MNLDQIQRDCPGKRGNIKDCIWTADHDQMEYLAVLCSRQKYFGGPIKIPAKQ